MKNLLKILGILITILSVSCKYEDYDDKIVGELIKNNSALFQDIEKITNQSNSNNPSENIVCIDFIYPLTLLVYDGQSVVDQVVIDGDESFSSFLGQLNANYNISISYPIKTVLQDGTVFSVANNQELKTAIDACSRPDIIAYCRSIFSQDSNQCVYRVAFNESVNNIYAGAVFYANENGSVKFDHLQQSYVGTWSFLFLNDELYLNINLDGNTQINLDWNHNFKVEIVNDSFIIETDMITFKLQEECSTNDTFNIGNQIPNRGVVFFKKSNFEGGWKFMESSLVDINNKEWACTNTNFSSQTASSLGKGYQNTLVNFSHHRFLNNYFTNPVVCSMNNNGTLISKETIEANYFNINKWFIPSIEELKLMYTNLHQQNIGNFSSSIYWSSTEGGNNKVLGIDFSNGQVVELNKNQANINCRAIRYF